jgi:hypothetical protein
MESRGKPVSPIVSSFPWIGAVLGKLIRVSNNNNVNQSDVTTQEMSQTVEETQSKLMSTVEIAANESSDVINSSSFSTTASSDKTVHDLSDLMERPTLINTGVIDNTTSKMLFKYNRDTFDNMTTSNIPGLIKSYVFPRDLITKNPVIASKIKQFSYFKADIKFQIKINCAPNVYGALLAMYVPVIEDLKLDFSNLTYQGVTSYPCKILDYSVDTSLTMSVPYINQFDYYNFSQSLYVDNGSGFETLNSPSAFGAILLFNLQSPEASASEKVSYSAFASFENIDLKLPVAELENETLGPYIAQADEIVRRIPAHDIMSNENVSPDLKLSYSTIPPDYSNVCYDKDEMSLSYVLKRENIIGMLEFKEGTNSEVDSYIGKCRCFPKRVDLNGVVKAPLQMGTFDYVSNLFGRYTGTVKIGIRLLKTKFHYGRIAVVFDPFNRLSRDVPAESIGTLLSTNYNMIIDLNGNDGEEGGSNYYSIEVPYLNNVGFSTIGVNVVGGTTGARTNVPGVKRGYYADVPRLTATPPIVAQRECYDPYLRFYALTELGYLTSAASSVKMYLSISAGDDYELSVPTVNVSACDPPVTVSSTFYCESMLRIVPKSDSQSDINLKSCVGEKISSLAELANRFTAPSVYNNPKIPYMVFEYNDEDVTIKSSTLIPSGVTLSLHINTPLGFKLSNYEAIAQLYRFSYGGRRYKFMSSSDSYLMSRLLHVPNFTGSNTGFSFPNQSSNRFQVSGAYICAPCSTTSVPLSGEMVVETGINNFLEVERPFYSNRKLISTRFPNRSNETTTLNQMPSSDDVLTQFTALSKNVDTDDIEVAPEEIVRVGPCYAEPDGSARLKQVRRDADLLNAAGNIPDSESLNSVNPLSFQERSFTPTDNSTKIKVRRATACNVLEALGTGAGLTFLQAPPCVVFG